MLGSWFCGRFNNCAGKSSFRARTSTRKWFDLTVLIKIDGPFDCLTTVGVQVRLVRALNCQSSARKTIWWCLMREFGRLQQGKFFNRFAPNLRQASGSVTSGARVSQMILRLTAVNSVSDVLTPVKSDEGRRKMAEQAGVSGMSCRY